MAERELFPSNSNKSKENKTLAVPEREHPKPVAKRLGGKKQETTLQKFAGLFLAEDVGDIGEYLVKDLIIPNIKDAMMNFMNALLWGDRRSGSVYRSGDGRQRTNYNKLSSSARVGSDRRSREKEDYSDERRQFDIDNIVFTTKAQADLILDRMEDYLDDYGQVTVGYLYELMDESGPYTLEYYGWRDLRNARIMRVRNGYSLELPRPVRLER